jgi:hypothetical protein
MAQFNVFLLFALAGLEMAVGVEPNKGDKVPPFAKTFPGCSCKFQDMNKAWSCEGIIAHPASLRGQQCGCCGGSGCDSKNRLDNDACMEIGVDQEEEVKAADKEKEEERKKKAIPDFGDAVVTTVRLPPGYCTHHQILAECKKIGQVPLCNSYGVYASMDRGKPGCRRWRNTNYCKNADNCWFPFMGGQGGPNEAKAAPFKKWQWANFADGTQFQELGLNKLKIGGYCLYAFNGGTTQAIFATGRTSSWSPANSAHLKWTYEDLEGKHSVADLNKQGYPTFCVNQKPLPYVRNGQ